MFGRGYAMRGRPARARSSRRFWIAVGTAAAVGGRAAYGRTTTALYSPRPAPRSGRADHDWAVRPRQPTLAEALVHVHHQVQVVRGIFRGSVDALYPRLTLDDALLGQVRAVSGGIDLHAPDDTMLVDGACGDGRLLR
jgi:hypothetical protein